MSEQVDESDLHFSVHSDQCLNRTAPWQQVLGES